ncbi:RING/leucine zipper protein [Tieghemostelium lacteum]|uniref:RING/leucine zipper protein n=1 Tax=Tieghemostelium lacteum TaxID=361077 RepID=A0A151ZAQ2_TIELA|nr:RING/leucine zipper protein [Tieghemostelium lacteum]|eukprot:KYQ91008.1 RING/leucine zipper protein [Tieghemostelium lacteum]
MDPLDEEIYKIITKGAPIQVEKVLNYDLNLKDALKSPYLIGAALIAGASCVYYWLKTNNDNQNNNNNNINSNNSNLTNTVNDHDGLVINRTTTTTTTTTTTVSSSAGNNLVNGYNVHHPLSNYPPVLYSNGETLSIDDQNRLLKENVDLRTDIEKDYILNSEMKDKIIYLEKHNRELKNELERERLCNICFENDKSVCWTSCGHRLCRRCAVVTKKSVRPECPFCQTPVDEYYTSYNT